MEKRKVGHRFNNFLVDTLKIRFSLLSTPIFPTVAAESVKKSFYLHLGQIMRFEL